ncbi:MAG: hypothetical protein COA78_16535 [Blastopirellula sp.]|nr:MAG: hypothetical protein COA78_16535 [Blastopirellula sp.]
MKNCIFCEIALHRLPSFTIYEDKKIIVFLSLDNHPLVVPKQHFSDVYELDDECAASIMQTTVRISRATKASTNCDDINLIQSNGRFAGQDVFHFHLHIKPRFKNDGVVLNWDTATVEEEKRKETCDAIKRHLI